MWSNYGVCIKSRHHGLEGVYTDVHVYNMYMYTPLHIHMYNVYLQTYMLILHV